MQDHVIEAADDLANIIIESCPHNSLAQYDSAPFLVPFLKKYGLYMEAPIRNLKILGHSWIDELGNSTMVNSLITDPQRKAFTQAHELGHQILHRKDLMSNPAFPIQTTDSIHSKFEIEQEANTFAAHLLLPDRVLNADMIEHNSRKSMKSQHHISYEALGYRIEDFLQERTKISSVTAYKLTSQFMASAPRSSGRIPLYQYWDEMRFHPDKEDRRPITISNEEIAIACLDPDLLRHRRLKANIIRQNKQSTNHGLQSLQTLSMNFMIGSLAESLDEVSPNWDIDDDDLLF